MTAQHLTTPHSADVIEKSHHHEGSEGHQVPGPPHSHDHDHHAKPSTGPLVALIALVLLLGGAALIGFRAPAVGIGSGRAGGGAASERAGIVVTLEGRVLLGSVATRNGVVAVTSPEDGEVLVPRSRVRWMSADGAFLTDEYWRDYGNLPIDTKHQRKGGGIVVIDTGEVFVGHVTQDERGYTVRWPYGSQTHTGEITIPRERVRHADLSHDTLTDDYWRKHRDAPLDPKYQRGAAAPRQGAARPTTTPAGPRDRRSQATLAQSTGRWEEATVAWAEVFGEEGQEADLKNLLRCAERFNETGYEGNDARQTTTQVHTLLRPFTHLPAVRTKLADMLFKTGLHFQVRHDVEQVRHWASALDALGAEQRPRVEALLQGAGELERGEHEEAHEHHGPERGE